MSLLQKVLQLEEKRLSEECKNKLDVVTCEEMIIFFDVTQTKPIRKMMPKVFNQESVLLKNTTKSKYVFVFKLLPEATDHEFAL